MRRRKQQNQTPKKDSIELTNNGTQYQNVDKVKENVSKTKADYLDTTSIAETVNQDSNFQANNKNPNPKPNVNAKKDKTANYANVTIVADVVVSQYANSSEIENNGKKPVIYANAPVVQ